MGYWFWIWQVEILYRDWLHFRWKVICQQDVAGPRGGRASVPLPRCRKTHWTRPPLKLVLLTAGAPRTLCAAAEPRTLLHGELFCAWRIPTEQRQPKQLLKSVNKEAQVYIFFLCFLIRSLSRLLWTQKKGCFEKVKKRGGGRVRKSRHLTTEAQFLPASRSNETLVYLCMHTCSHIGALCISENFCSFEWGTERERRNVTVSVLMSGGVSCEVLL